jgi:hypothetical protein
MAEELLERPVFRKVTFRLMAFLCLLYIVNVLDRMNISFARLPGQSACRAPSTGVLVPDLRGPWSCARSSCARNSRCRQTIAASDR